ncbi:hypothetical protein HDV00_005552 [Rhizophlyctis rosea]|nr:hypothetical protein HDV00_005552 [Rhizophlyctis rosea]
MKQIDDPNSSITRESNFKYQQSQIQTIADARRFCKKWFGTCCHICLSGKYQYERFRHTGYPSDEEEEVQQCSHSHEGWEVQIFCDDCHKDVFHQRMVLKVEKLMKDHGFKRQGWKYYAENGWEQRRKVIDDTDASDDEERRDGGYHEEDACSDNVSIHSAKRWIRKKASKRKPRQKKGKCADSRRSRKETLELISRPRKKLQAFILQAHRSPADFEAAHRYLSMVEKMKIRDRDLLKDSKLRKVLKKIATTNFDQLDPAEVDPYNLSGRAEVEIRAAEEMLRMRGRGN